MAKVLEIGVDITVKNADGDPDTKATIVCKNSINYEPKVSVIIPVYNTEEYLRECLDSVVNQTLKEIEIICVDDGSTDSSLEILKEYAQKDNRFTIITQKNLHAGVARNAGLAIAKGEYVHFLDSDDWVDSEALKKIFELAIEKEVDIVKFKNKTFDNVKKEYIESSYTNISSFPEDKFEKILNINSCIDIIKLPDCPWSGIYKRKFLQDNNILFDNLKCVNDVSFFISAVIKGSIYVTKDNLVNYRVNNPTSLIGIRAKNFQCQLESYSIIERRIKDESNYIKHLIKSRILCGIGYRIDAYFKQEISNTVKQEIFHLCKRFFKNLSIRFLYNINQQNLYNTKRVQYIAELIKKSKNYQEYKKLIYDKNLEKQIYNYINIDNVIMKENIINPKLSIIIPVYNTAQYIEECINSIQEQSFDSYEIICVDDGSNDESYSILKKLQERNNKIILIKQENRGSAIAKNKGLYFAEGEYIAFMDSDDLYPTTDVLDNLYQKASASNANICGGSLRQFKDNREIINESWFEKEYIFEKEGYIKYSDYQYDYGFTRFIYKHSFLKENSMYFPEYLRGEDPPFFIKAMCLAQKFYAIPNDVYYYRILHKTTQWTPKMLADVILNYNECVHLSKKFKMRKLYKRIISRISPRFLGMLQQNIENNIIQNVLNETLKDKDINFAYKNLIMYKPKVSVIISVYNAEKYLTKSLDSLVNQTLKNIEIICVNDGSTDSSIEILKKYAQNDNRIIIINQKNQGLACSRNNALKKVKGEFVQFVDADDYIKEDALELLYNKAIKNNLDLISFGGINFKNDTLEQYSNPYYEFRYLPENFNIDCFNYYDCKNFINKMAVSSCLTMYRHEFIKEKNIIFPPKIYFEDNLFFCKAVTQAKRCGILKSTLYYRRIHSTSITQNWEKHHKDYIKVVDMVLKYLKSINIDENVYKNYVMMYTSEIINHYNQFSIEYQKQYYNHVKRFIKKYDPLLINQITKPYKNKITEKMFSVKNNKERTHKIITILGIKIKIKRKLNNQMNSFMENIFSVKNIESRNNKWHKVVTILGIKFKFLNKYLMQKFQLQRIEQRVKQICSNTEKQIKQIDSKLNNSTQNINNSYKNIESLIKKSNDNYTNSINELNKQIEEISNKTNEFIGNFDNQIEEIDNNIVSYVKNIEFLIDELNCNRNNQIQNINNALAQINNKQDENLQNLTTKLEQTNGELNNILQNVNEKFSNVNESLTNFLNVIESLRVENSANNTLISQVKEDNANLQKTIEQQKNRILKLQTELGYINDWQQNFYKTNPQKYPIRLTDIEKEAIKNNLSNAKNYLEFGSGGSTFLALTNSNTKIFSVESDKDWIEYLKSYKAISNAINENRLSIEHINIGQTKEWGFPVDDSGKDNYPNYSNEIFNKIPKEEIDLVFVDGRFRVACTLNTILNCPKSTKIMFHDYTIREYYHLLEEFLDIVETVDTLVIFKIKDNIDIDKVKSLYEQYKYTKE